MPYNSYSSENIIGCTNDSIVVKTTLKKLGSVAIKFFMGNQSLFERELLYLKRLRDHSNVIKIYGTYEGPDGDGIVMELLSHNLKQVIKTQTYGTTEMYNWFSQISSALSSLHDIGHLHGDIKPSNMLLDASLTTVKLIDFGTARCVVKHISAPRESCTMNSNKLDKKTCLEKNSDCGTSEDSLRRWPSARRGTKGYMAPEIEGNDDYNRSADVYSFGMTILVTATKKSVWNDTAWSENKYNIAPALKIAVDRMLKKYSVMRPIMRNVHTYFKKLKCGEHWDEDLLLPPTEPIIYPSYHRPLKRGHIIDLPCYGPKDFHDEEIPSNVRESTSKIRKNLSMISLDMADLRPVKALSNGSFGYLSLVETKLLGVVVLKQNRSYRNEIAKRAAAEVLLSREVVAMNSISQHPNIVRFYGTVHGKTGNKPVGFLMEYMSKGSIQEYYKYEKGEDDCLTNALRNNWILQIANALSFLHSHFIIHRDINPNNILLSGDLQTAKVGDFGLARDNRDDETLTLCVGTQDYTAPEMIEAKAYSSSADIWSFGATIAYIYSVKERRHYEEKPCMHLEPNIRRTCFRLLNGSEKRNFQVVNLIRRCCAHEPSSRPTAFAIVDAIREIIASGDEKANPERSNNWKFWRDVINPLRHFIFHY